MKYCLSSKQEFSYLLKADEIKVDYQDSYHMLDLVEQYPEATFIIMCYSDLKVDFNEVEVWQTLSKNRVILCLSSMNDVIECKNREIPFYFGYPVKTYYELNALAKLGVSYVRLAEPLFFDMDKVKSVGVPVRAIPNIAYVDGLPREDGVCGGWMRPEDVDMYAEYVDVLEFEDADDLKKEQALFRIYAEQKKWPGDLNLLITNLDYKVTNRLIDPTAMKKRLNCRQVCQSGGACRTCYRAFSLADVEKLKSYVEATDQN